MKPGGEQRIRSSDQMPPVTPYSQTTLAPWKHPSELAMLRDWFYPHHIPRSFFDISSSVRADHRQDAVNLVSLWQFRHPNLPHPLTCTAHLTEAILHDQAGRRDHLSSLALQNIYAMTFCRFVSALVDRDVRKSVTATIVKDAVAAEKLDAASGPQRGQSSMFANALALGLPESFVELRHQANHNLNEMPSLEMLRMRTEEALEWLWERWWKFNAQGSVEPALSEWQEKHATWPMRKFGETATEQKPQSVKRKRSQQAEDDQDGPVCAEPRGPVLADLNGQQQKSDSTPESRGSVQQPQAWTMHFLGSLDHLPTGPEMRSPRATNQPVIAPDGRVVTPSDARHTLTP